MLPPFFSGVILAAGSSSRMGRPKQLMPLGGRPLLRYALDAATASCLAEIVLVLGHGAREIEKALRGSAPTIFRTVINRAHASGQSGSLRLGLRSVDPRAEAAVVLLGDQPAVTAALVDRVAADFRRGGRPAARPVYTMPDGQPIPGHPVFLGRGIWRALDDVSGDQGARSLFEAHPEWVLDVPMAGAPPADINTLEDYRRAIATERR